MPRGCVDLPQTMSLAHDCVMCWVKFWHVMYLLRAVTVVLDAVTSSRDY